MKFQAAVVPLLSLAIMALGAAVLAQSVIVKEPVRIWPKGMPPNGIKEKDDYGDHIVSVSHREENGDVEVHDHKDDVMIVQSGEATLIYGGKGVDLKPTAPGEQHGSKIEGGATAHVGPGDVITIAAGVPHQFLVPKGGQITYTLVKILRR
jgi:mannose-6-phosphate isomerase-like protein (cupin superfamily)